MCTVNCIETTKIKKKKPGMAHSLMTCGLANLDLEALLRLKFTIYLFG